MKFVHMGIPYESKYYILGERQPKASYLDGHAISTYIANIKMDKKGLNKKYLLTLNPTDRDITKLSRKDKNAEVIAIPVDKKINRLYYYFKPAKNRVIRYEIDFGLEDSYAKAYRHLFDSLDLGDSNDVFVFLFSLDKIYERDREGTLNFIKKLYDSGYKIATKNLTSINTLKDIGEFLNFISFDEAEFFQIGRYEILDSLDLNGLVLVHHGYKKLSLIGEDFVITTGQLDFIYPYTFYPSVSDFVDMAFVYYYYAKKRDIRASLELAKDVIRNVIDFRFEKLNLATHAYKSKQEPLKI